MVRSDESWLSVVDAFQTAGVTGDGWYAALDALARATGSRAGELIGLGSANTVPFNWVTDLGPEWVKDFIAVGGGDPAVNPFVRAGAPLPVLEVRSSEEFITAGERRSDRFLNEHVGRYDIPHVCLTPLVKDSGMLVGLAVMRSASQGEIPRAERDTFASIAPHVRAAVLTQMALEHQGAALVRSAMEALSLPVFVCDGKGRVRALTPAAEGLVTNGSGLRLAQGRLHGSTLAETKALSDAIDRAVLGLTRPGAPLAQTVVVRAKDGSAPLALEVVALPRRAFEFGFGARVLVVAPRREAQGARRQVILRAGYGLTGAEADVALELGNGKTPERIAQERGVALGTVRAQIKAVYAKLHVNRQVELTAKLNQF